MKADTDGRSWWARTTRHNRVYVVAAIMASALGLVILAVEPFTRETVGAAAVVTLAAFLQISTVGSAVASLRNASLERRAARAAGLPTETFVSSVRDAGRDLRAILGKPWTKVWIAAVVVGFGVTALATSAGVPQSRAENGGLFGGLAVIAIALLVAGLNKLNDLVVLRRPNRTRMSQAINLLPLVVATTMLLLAAFDDWPRGFYQMLRVVVCGSAAYVAVQTNDHRRSWPWVMGAIAVLFNPIVPITFTLRQWQPIDLAVAIVFLIAIAQEVLARLRLK